MKFENYMEMNIQMKPIRWQQEAADAFLSVMKKFSQHRTVKTLLMEQLSQYVEDYGNDLDKIY